MSKHFKSPAYAATVAHFLKACAFSRAHSNLAAYALETFGSQGPGISGCVRSHFPESIKTELRGLARAVSEESDKAREAAPKYSRADSIRTLGRYVATRYGSGFYGPQPEAGRAAQ
jgi:hypothetical protein